METKGLHTSSGQVSVCSALARSLTRTASAPAGGGAPLSQRAQRLRSGRVGDWQDGAWETLSSPGPHNSTALVTCPKNTPGAVGVRRDAALRVDGRAVLLQLAAGRLQPAVPARPVGRVHGDGEVPRAERSFEDVHDVPLGARTLALQLAVHGLALADRFLHHLPLK